MGAVRRHMGHCRSSNTMMAVCEPLGGRSTVLIVSCAEAVVSAARIKEEMSTRNVARCVDLDFMKFRLIWKFSTRTTHQLDARTAVPATWSRPKIWNLRHSFMVTERGRACQGDRGAFRVNLGAENRGGNAL